MADEAMQQFLVTIPDPNGDNAGYFHKMKRLIVIFSFAHKHKLLITNIMQFYRLSNIVITLIKEIEKVPQDIKTLWEGAVVQANIAMIDREMKKIPLDKKTSLPNSLR